MLASEASSNCAVLQVIYATQRRGRKTRRKQGSKSRHLQRCDAQSSVSSFSHPHDPHSRSSACALRAALVPYRALLFRWAILSHTHSSISLLTLDHLTVRCGAGGAMRRRKSGLKSSRLRLQDDASDRRERFPRPLTGTHTRTRVSVGVLVVFWTIAPVPDDDGVMLVYPSGSDSIVQKLELATMSWQPRDGHQNTSRHIHSSSTTFACETDRKSSRPQGRPYFRIFLLFLCLYDFVRFDIIRGEFTT